MPEIAFLECAVCGDRLSAEVVQTVCPRDAGPLYVRYDMDAMKRSARRETPAALAVASPASAGMWRYRDVLPEAVPVTLGEGWTAMIASRRYEGLLIKQEAANPGGTSEARGVALAVTMARAYGKREVAIASEGGAAHALAAYAAAAGVRAHVFAPGNVALADQAACMAYGADVLVLEGSVSDCAEMLEVEIRRQREDGVVPEERWCDLSAWKEPFLLEGMKTVGYEIAEQLGWHYPEAIVGSCDLGLVGAWKAFEEMEQLDWLRGRRPRIFTVQEEAAASQIGGEVLRGVMEQTGGRPVRVDEATIAAATLDWARNEGLLLPPKGAGAAAVYEALLASGEVQSGERVVLINPEAEWRYAETMARSMRVRRSGALPTSLPVGGIITPV